MIDSPYPATGVYEFTLTHSHDPTVSNPVEARRTQAAVYLYSELRQHLPYGRSYFYREAFIPAKAKTSLETAETLVLYIFLVSPMDCKINEHFADITKSYDKSNKIIIANRVFIRYEDFKGTLEFSIWKRVK